MAVLLRFDRISVFGATIRLLIATVIQRSNRILVLLMRLGANVGQFASGSDRWAVRRWVEGAQCRNPRHLVASSNLVGY